MKCWSASTPPGQPKPQSRRTLKMSEREIRCYSGEVRAETHDSEPSRIIGYGSVFDSRSELIFGSFREIIRPGAFDEVLNDDVRALFNHDPNFILGRRSAGTLALTVDERGCVMTSPCQKLRQSVIWCWHQCSAGISTSPLLHFASPATERNGTRTRMVW